MSQHFVEFPGSLGALRGVWHQPDRATPTPAVVLLNGFSGHHIEHQFLFVEVGRRLTANGIAALRVDFYGSGDSDGQFDDMTVWTERDDAQRMFAFAAAQPNIDPARVGVLGFSLGGAVAALLVGVEPRVRALTVWAPAIRLHMADMFERMDEPTWGSLRVGQAFVRSCREAKPLEALNGYTGSTLVLHGDRDQLVPLSDGAAFADKVGGRLSVIAGADHIFDDPDWREALISATVRHFMDALA